MADLPVPRAKAYGIASLTLLVPGLGHWALGHRGRAVAFAALVLFTFGFGLALGGALFPFRAENWLFRLGALGQVGMGLPWLLCKLAGLGALTPERATSVMFGYGNTFLVTAGLMNMLLSMDAFDIAVGRKA